MGSLGWSEILMIMVIALIIFGPRKLPELGKTLGQGLAQFRRASEDFKRQWEDEVELEKRKLDAPPLNPSVSSEPVLTHAADYGAGELEQQPAASASAEQEPLTVARGDSAIKETKRDWM